jgi:hypothetical protein
MAQKFFLFDMLHRHIGPGHVTFKSKQRRLNFEVEKPTFKRIFVVTFMLSFKRDNFWSFEIGLLDEIFNFQTTNL